MARAGLHKQNRRHICESYALTMQLKIFTLPFDEETEGFPDEIISEFCLNKKVLRIETQFFRREGMPFWSVAVHYEIVLPETDKLRDLDDSQKLLFQRLKEWRKEAAAKEGLPAYLIATNAQFIQMIRLQCRTLESFKNVKGFGKKRAQKYGKRINELIKGFYESEAAKPEVQPAEEPANDGKGDMPY